MSDGLLLKDGLDQLRAEGFAISPDRLHRFRCFGIASTRTGREFQISPQALFDLRYVLNVERNFQLARDRDALCLQLAYRGYPTVPWAQVHRGGAKRVAGMFTRVDRELHRANDWAGAGFPPRRIPHLARQLARHYIPKHKIAENPAFGPARELFEHVLQMLLKVAYNGEPVQERDVLRGLLMLRAQEAAAMQLLTPLTVMLNTIAPMLRARGDSLYEASLRKDVSETEIVAAVRTMQIQSQLLDVIKAAGITAAVPSLTAYPDIEPQHEFEHSAFTALLSVLYASALDVNASEAGRAHIERYAAGDIEATNQLIRNMGATVTMIPKVLGINDAE